eukprot:TRINITY_DN6431_c0_g1_i4.p1 TRINITY_DN6431_c0_g1~~TRINITY_DN6431_c0_g1_i4.p1  ORF type:complete len:141 (-),score=5.66 TRINITY_DN6431_c0_g1_i4:124-486(-)
MKSFALLLFLLIGHTLCQYGASPYGYPNYDGPYYNENQHINIPMREDPNAWDQVAPYREAQQYHRGGGYGGGYRGGYDDGRHRRGGYGHGDGGYRNGYGHGDGGYRGGYRHDDGYGRGRY